MVMDAIDRRQRVRRILDALADVTWLGSLYPIDQHEDIWANLSSARTHLMKAYDLAQKEAVNV